MKVFLTGTTGYIGSAVAETLVAAGHSVTGLVRSPEVVAQVTAQGITPLVADLSETDKLAEAARAADGVVHLAQPRFNPQGDFAAQIAETGALISTVLNALLGALAGSGKPLILTGGTGAYGDTGDRIADESSPPLNLPMLASMQQNERRVLDADGLAGMATRPAIVYGRKGGPVQMQLDMARQFGHVFYTGDGSNPLSFVHVEDVADLYLLMLERPQAGLLLNVVAEPFVTQKELLQAVSTAVGLGGVVEPMPPELVERMGGGGSIFSRNMRVSAAKAKAFGWQPSRPSVLDELTGGAYN